MGQLLTRHAPGSIFPFLAGHLAPLPASLPPHSDNPPLGLPN